jgi:hypothetical protein
MIVSSISPRPERVSTPRLIRWEAIYSYNDFISCFFNARSLRLWITSSFTFTLTFFYYLLALSLFKESNLFCNSDAYNNMALFRPVIKKCYFFANSAASQTCLYFFSNISFSSFILSRLIYKSVISLSSFSMSFFIFLIVSRYICSYWVANAWASAYNSFFLRYKSSFSAC